MLAHLRVGVRQGTDGGYIEVCREVVKMPASLSALAEGEVAKRVEAGDMPPLGPYDGIEIAVGFEVSQPGGDKAALVAAELAEHETRTEAARFDPSFLHRLRQERDHQIRRWGDEHDRRHTMYDWIVFLTKHLGRAAHAAMHEDKTGFDRAMIRLAALAAAVSRAHYPKGLLITETEDAVRHARRLAEWRERRP